MGHLVDVTHHDSTMDISFGDGLAVVRRDRSSRPIVAKVLARETGPTQETVYLDRLVHAEGQNWQEWRASGALSTILTRQLPALAGA